MWISGKEVSTLESLVDSLSSDMRTWVDKIKKSVSEVAVSKVKMKELPSYTILWGKRLKIFFIDEANRLRSLLHDKEGLAALESVFQWFVLYTKEKCHFHVIMASSDSFFNLRVENSLVLMYVLGHLSKNDAKNYWVYMKSVGSSMFLMSSFLEEYCDEKGKGLIGKNPCNFQWFFKNNENSVLHLNHFKHWKKTTLLIGLRIIWSRWCKC